MKRFNLLSLMLIALTSGMLMSCKSEAPVVTELPFLYNADGTANSTSGTQIGNGQQEFEIAAGSYTLPKGTYVLKGWVYVTNGATLTIEPGTLIKGDKNTKAALIVEPGGKLIAKGNANSPIVFTSNQPAGSRKPGDWGGLILCGNAKVNQGTAQIEGGPRTVYGGSNDADNSGIVEYVRIEFAGYPFMKDKEINGFTFGGVGSATVVDHVQVSYSNDDSYEWFGGTVSPKYLIAYHGWDDDFDTDFGFSGKLQYLLGVRSPKIADTSRSNGFESDNDGSGSTKEPNTACTFSNVTLIGPMGQDAGFQNTSTFINADESGYYKGANVNPNNGAQLGIFQASMQIRRNSHLSVFNSVAVGYPVGLIVENDKGSTTQTAATNGVLKVQNVIYAQMGHIGSDANGKDYVYSTDGGTTFIDGIIKTPFSETYFTSGKGNKYYANISDLKFKQPNSTAANASWLPQTGSPLLSGADFTDAMVSNGFDKVGFVGAFGSEDWTAGWANWDPQNTAY